MNKDDGQYLWGCVAKAGDDSCRGVYTRAPFLNFETQTFMDDQDPRLEVCDFWKLLL